MANTLLLLECNHDVQRLSIAEAQQETGSYGIGTRIEFHQFAFLQALFDMATRYTSTEETLKRMLLPLDSPCLCGLSQGVQLILSINITLYMHMRSPISSCMPGFSVCFSICLVEGRRGNAAHHYFYKIRTAGFNPCFFSDFLHHAG